LGSLCALWTLAVGTLIAQQEGAVTRQPTKLDLEMDTSSPGTQVTGTPGGQVGIILVIRAPRGVQVGSTINAINFPDRFLSFQEVREGFSALAAEAEITAVVEKDQDSATHSTLRIAVTAQRGTRIPNGGLAEIVFKVAEQAPEGTVELTNLARAFTTDDPPQSVDPVSARNGVIQISRTPIFSCFFYMH